MLDKNYIRIYVSVYTGTCRTTCAGSMVAQQTVKLQSPVRIWHLTNLSVSSWESQNWVDSETGDKNIIQKNVIYRYSTFNVPIGRKIFRDRPIIHCNA